MLQVTCIIAQDTNPKSFHLGKMFCCSSILAAALNSNVMKFQHAILQPRYQHDAMDI